MFKSLLVAAIVATVTPGAQDLYSGTRKISTHADLASCVAAAKARGSASYTCRTRTGVVVAVTVDPPPVCTSPKPADETQAGTCPAGTSGTWSQSRAYVSAAYPTCWAVGPWSPAAAPSGTCATPVDPPVTDALAVRNPDDTDTYVDLDRSTNGSCVRLDPCQKSQLTLAVFQSLTAGHQLVFLNASGTGTYTPIALSGVKAGTAAARITVRTYPGQKRATWNFPANGLAFAVDYWDFRDFAAVTKQNGFRFGYGGWDGLGPDVNTGTVRLIDYSCTRTGGGTTDNSGCITASNGSSGSFKFLGLYRGMLRGPLGEGNNQSSVWIDYGRDFEIIGNLFIGSAQPIYLKHTNQTSDEINNGFIVNNIFQSAGIGVRASINGATWRNNAFDGVDLSLDEDGGSPSFSGSNNVLDHNTFKDADWLAPYTGMRSSNNRVSNTLMLGKSRYADSPFAKYDNGNLIDYTATDTANHYQRASGNYTLAGYRQAFPGNEAHGIAGLVQLVGGDFSEPKAWAQLPGSVGIANASDGTDRGVNAAKLLTVTP